LNIELLLKICDPKDSLYLLNKKRIQNYWKRSDIYDLIKINDLNGIKYLVSVGVNIKADDNWAVQIASSDGHLEMVKYLVSIGADITVCNNLAVGWASYNGHLEVVKYLVTMGSDITADNNWAVKWASRNGKIKVVNYLVSMGADDC
jgi:hypothetical protein